MPDQLETNKQIVRDNIELAFNQRNVEEAVARYHIPGYRQHHPSAPDGPEAFIRLAHWLAQTYPSFRFDIKRLIAEGDLVVSHGHLIREPGDRGIAVVDIFRIHDGKIVEHWDVEQEVPEKSANNNTMF